MIENIPARAQTNAFTYQGRLSDDATAASGNYDLGFALFDVEIGVTQIGTAITRLNVIISGGIFTVQLDFGAGAFPVRIVLCRSGFKKTMETDFTTLTPRQPVTSTPMRFARSTRRIPTTQLMRLMRPTRLIRDGLAASSLVQTTARHSFAIKRRSRL